MDDVGLQYAVHQWLQRNESNFYWAEIGMCFCSEVEEDLTKVETVLKNTLLFSNVVMIHEIFIRLTCKHLVIKNGRH